MSSKDHYDEKYFSWQKYVGKFGGQANKIKFDNLICENQKVLDFGCGGGYLLSSYNNIERFGVEINETAIEEAKKNGTKIFKSSRDLPNNFPNKPNIVPEKTEIPEFSNFNNSFKSK